MKTTEMQDLVSANIQYKDWSFYVGRNGSTAYLQAQFVDEGKRQHGRKWMLSEFMTKSEIIQTALKAVLAAEEHEAREKFLYRGKSIFGPHFDVDELAGICDRTALDVRELVASAR